MVTFLILAGILGCSRDDESLTELAQESMRQQARQNEEIAKASRELVEADAQARRELIIAQQGLQDQQAEIHAQHSALESERKEIARQRSRDPIVAAAIVTLGTLLAAVAPLVLAWFVLRAVQPHDHDQALGEILAIELTNDKPVLLPPRGEPPVTPRLPGPVGGGSRPGDAPSIDGPRGEHNSHQA